MLDLVFTGIGSAFCPQLGNTSAVFWKADTLYLLDCGSLVFATLKKSEALLHAKEIVVFLTHTHADHAGSLGTLISYCKHVQPIPICIVHPDEEVGDLLHYNGITNEQYTLRTGMSYSDKNVSARFYSVPHTQSLNAYGILLTDSEESVYYSGDAGDVPGEIWQEFIAGGIARMYQDVSLTGKMGGAHADYRWFVKNCPEMSRKRFFPMHMDEACIAQTGKDGFGQVSFL